MSEAKVSTKFLALLAVVLFWLGGLVPAVIVMGYILLKEKNDQLHFLVLRAAILWIFVVIINWLIGVVPMILGFVGEVCELFDGTAPYTPTLNNINSVLYSALNIFENVMYLLMVIGILFTKGGILHLGFLDTWARKAMGYIKQKTAPVVNSTPVANQAVRYDPMTGQPIVPQAQNPVVNQAKNMQGNGYFSSPAPIQQSAGQNSQVKSAGSDVVDDVFDLFGN